LKRKRNIRLLIKLLELAIRVDRNINRDSQVRKRRNFSHLVKQIILTIQGYRCKKCNSILIYPNFDHTDGNRSNNDISNCQALCPNCHAKKTRKT